MMSFYFDIISLNMKGNLFLLILPFLLGGCNSSSEKSASNKDLVEIVINPEEDNDFLDLSDVLSDSIEIVPLETTEECLMSNVRQIELYKDKIYVLDERESKVYVFSTSGCYLHSIGRKGRGPGEYSILSCFTIMEDSMIIQDQYSHKFVVYDLNGNSCREIPYGAYHLEIMSFDNIAYLISNYWQSSYGNINLFKFDFNTSSVISSEISFAEKEKAKVGYGLIRYSSRYVDEATLIYPLNDTIYTLKKDVVYPSYVIRFTARNLPENLDVDSDELFRYVRKNRYLKGLDYLQNAKDYLLGYYLENSVKYFLYDKKNASVRIGKWLRIGLLGNMFVHYFYTTANGELYIIQDSGMFSTNWKSMGTYCTNSYYREKIDSIVSKIGDDSNPILIKCKFREKDE